MVRNGSDSCDMRSRILRHRTLLHRRSSRAGGIQPRRGEVARRRWGSLVTRIPRRNREAGPCQRHPGSQRGLLPRATSETRRMCRDTTRRWLRPWPRSGETAARSRSGPSGVGSREEATTISQRCERGDGAGAPGQDDGRFRRRLRLLSVHWKSPAEATTALISPSPQFSPATAPPVLRKAENGDLVLYCPVVACSSP